MKFSVLLPTRDRLELLQLAVKSVLSQDFSDFEIVVSDNNSTQSVGPWLASLADSRIVSLRHDLTLSVTENWNAALNASTGDYVIMLGDDDALCPGYFSTLAALVARYDHPDCVYHGAYLFTYPGVVPGKPMGLLHESRNAVFWREGKSTYLLSKNYRERLVFDAMRLYSSYSFNMQFVTVARSAIARFAYDEQLYHSPYPDYFAMNHLMLNADTVLIHEPPLVSVGVSPKSFGWYFQNHREELGNAHLAIDQRDSGPNTLRTEDLLPGTSMNTNWLHSMALLQVANASNPRLPEPSLKRYRHKQIIFFGMLVAKKRRLSSEILEFQRALTARERVFFRLVRVIGYLGSPGLKLLQLMHTTSQKRWGYLLRVAKRRVFRRTPIISVPTEKTILDAPELASQLRH